MWLSGHWAQEVGDGEERKWSLKKLSRLFPNVLENPTLSRCCGLLDHLSPGTFFDLYSVNSGFSIRPGSLVGFLWTSILVFFFFPPGFPLSCLSPSSVAFHWPHVAFSGLSAKYCCGLGTAGKSVLEV